VEGEDVYDMNEEEDMYDDDIEFFNVGWVMLYLKQNTVRKFFLLLNLKTVTMPSSFRTVKY
jgi:hypothetical protein